MTEPVNTQDNNKDNDNSKGKDNESSKDNESNKDNENNKDSQSDVKALLKYEIGRLENRFEGIRINDYSREIVRLRAKFNNCMSILLFTLIIMGLLTSYYIVLCATSGFRIVSSWSITFNMSLLSTLPYQYVNVCDYQRSIKGTNKVIKSIYTAVSTSVPCSLPCSVPCPAPCPVSTSVPCSVPCSVPSSTTDSTFED